MATEIRVPTLGESVSEATIGRWFKKAGDTVKADEPIVELETDKVTLEVNAPAAGVLSEIAVKDGETVSPGALLGQIERRCCGREGKDRQDARRRCGGSPAKAAKDPVAARFCGGRRTCGSGRGRCRLRQPRSTAGCRGPGRARERGFVRWRRDRHHGADLGESVSEATVAKWFKKAGDTVKADEPLVELETDKVTLEVNAPAAGVLSAIGVETGATVQPGPCWARSRRAAPRVRPRPMLRPSRRPPCRPRARQRHAAGPVGRQDRGRERHRHEPGSRAPADAARC